MGEDHEDLFTHSINVFPEVDIPVLDFICGNYATRDEVAPSTDNHCLFIQQENGTWRENDVQFLCRKVHPAHCL